MEQNYCLFCMNPISEDTCSNCGKKSSEYQAAPHHLQPGTILAGKYMVGAVLGEGGFGITYIGRDVNLDIKVAIKEYFPSGVVNRNNTSSTEISAHIGDAQAFFEKGKDSFLGEARTLAKFSNEPSIVSVRDFFSENNTAYIVMEYLEGIDLKDYIASNGKMSFEQVTTMLAPIMTALSKIHSTGLIHRDISPANIMILKDGTVKLLDFGAAREVGGADEKSLSILLKPGYAPEEQYRTKGNQGPWTDVYALSATMYKMLTGLTPVDAMNRVFSDDIRRITELNPTVTPEQEAIILKGMAVQQTNRYQSVMDLYNDCLAGSIKQPTPAENNEKPSNDNTNNWMNAWGDNTTAEPVKAKAKTDDSIKGDKKPSIPAFVGSIFTGLATLYFVLNTVSLFIDEASPILSIILTLLFGAGTFFLGKLYFPRIDNKKRKPNVFCLVAGIISTLITLFCAWAAYVNLTSVWTQDIENGKFGLATAIVSLAFPVFFGYFFYPRLERKKKKLAIRIYGGIGAAAVVLLVVGIIFTSLTTINIGDEKIKRNATQVSLSLDAIPDSDLQKLKELKSLESLEIFECFLDDADVKTLGELTNLKQLSIVGNTDITDVSPLNNLKNLTYLNIGITNTTDISCLSGLTNLETLKIGSTDIADVSIVSTFTKLETFEMSSLDKLDVSTIKLPASIETLDCSNNKLASLEFLATIENLTNLYASNNELTDISPIAKFNLYILDLSVNKISDITPIKAVGINDLDLSTNEIADASCLKGTTAYQLDLAYNKITDIGFLKDNSRIGMVKLNNNAITDISVLKDCFNIHSLNISFNQIADISAVATIDDLTLFEARGNKINSIAALSSCAKLIEGGHSLDLRDNEIVDISPLASFTKTSHIYLSGNKIVDISPLKNCLALEMVKLNNNNISDVSVVNALSNLYIIELVNNPISNLEYLSFENRTRDSVTLRITYNESIDFTKLAQVNKLMLIVYDATPRAENDLRKLGFAYFPSTVNESVDEVDANEDLEAEETTEENNG